MGPFHICSKGNYFQIQSPEPPQGSPFIYLASGPIFIRCAYIAPQWALCRFLPNGGYSGRKKTAPIVGSLLLFTIFCTYMGFCLGARIRRMLRLCSSNVGLKTWRLVLSATKYKLLKLGVGCKTPKTDS